MGSFTDKSNVDFYIQPKKKKKKETIMLKRDIRNKKNNQRFFLKNTADIYFRKSALFNFFVSFHFLELAFFEFLARIYFCKFDQNSRKWRKLILAKINPLKVGLV